MSESLISVTDEVAVTEARDRLGELISRVEYRDDRIVLTRRGRAVAALVPIEVLRDLEAAEDAVDLEAARAAMAEPGENIPLAVVMAEFAAEDTKRAG